MKHIHVLMAGLLLAGMSCGGARAAVVLDDPLDGSTLGVASGVVYGPGNSGGIGDLAAVFDYNSTDRIKYEASMIPQAGTVSFSIKSQFDGYDMVLDTIGGSPSTTTGDWQVGIRPDNTLRFNVYANGTWNRLKGTTPISSDTWTYVAISFGPLYGMKLYVNGIAEGAFEAGGNYLGQLKDTAMFVGDYDGDANAWAFTGSLDDLRVSDVENDVLLTSVPEPGSILALLGGLAGLPLLRRRR